MVTFQYHYCIVVLLAGGSEGFPLEPRTTYPKTTQCSRRVREAASALPNDDIAATDCQEIRPALNSVNRRQALTRSVAGAVSLVGSWTATSSAVLAAITEPDPQGITTLVLDSPDVKIGVQLYDVTIYNPNNEKQTVAAVKGVNPAGAAASQNIRPGMILLGNYENASQSIVSRIQNGPYPIVLQFYDLGKVGDHQNNPVSPEIALLEAQQPAPTAPSSSSSNGGQGPQLSTKGTGLVIKTVQKPKVPCPDGKSSRVRRGDTITVNFEARVASPGGPLYDSSTERGGPVTFQVGSNQAVNGVDIGVYDMCPGEVRELDIPASLGYGRSGSVRFDVPPDVRLWWRLELVDLVKKQ